MHTVQPAAQAPIPSPPGCEPNGCAPAPATHPLLRECSEPVTALVWALFSLVIWGAMFPMTVYAAFLH